MARKRTQPETDDAGGAPEWMVTFSDCMTLLLTFFVMLLSFSSFDNKEFRKMTSAFMGGWPSISYKKRATKDSLLPTKQIVYTSELTKGSEKPTESQGKTNGLKKETESIDFHSLKIFSIQSKRIFWGKGNVISSEGCRVLSAMAAFLSRKSNRVVISETGGDGSGSSEMFGLLRGWAVLEYLCTKQGLDKSRFNLSASSTAAQRFVSGGETVGSDKENKRVLEFVLLERSICN